MFLQAEEATTRVMKELTSHTREKCTRASWLDSNIERSSRSSEFKALFTSNPQRKPYGIWFLYLQLGTKVKWMNGVVSSLGWDYLVVHQPTNPPAVWWPNTSGWSTHLRAPCNARRIGKAMLQDLVVQLAAWTNRLTGNLPSLHRQNAGENSWKA